MAVLKKKRPKIFASCHNMAKIEVPDSQERGYCAAKCGDSGRNSVRCKAEEGCFPQVRLHTQSLLVDVSAE